MGDLANGDVVQVGSSSTTATVIDLVEQKDDAGEAYTMATLRGARGRVFHEETSRLTKVVS